MVAHDLPKRARFFVESTFATAPADWTASGSNVYVIDPDFAEAKQGVVENANIRTLALDPHDMIATLRSGGSIKFAAYMHSHTANAAEGGTATAYPLTDMLHNAMGGRDLGRAIGFAGGTASAPEVDSETGFVIGDWIFAYDTSAGTGQFYRIVDLPGADVLTLDRDLHFTPDAGGADVAHAVICCYLHELSLSQHTHAQHKTASMLLQGQLDERAEDVSGLKLAATIEPITAGEPMRVSFDGKLITFRREGLSSQALTGTVYGEQGLVPGSGRTSYFKFAAQGDPLATTLVRGPITPTLGIGWEHDQSAAGVEGANGYVATGFGEAALEVTVDYDDDWPTAFRAGTHYHALTQIGATPSAAVGIYCPNLEIIAEPVPMDVGGLTSATITMRAHADTHADSLLDASALTGDDYYKAISPIQVLFVA